MWGAEQSINEALRKLLRVEAPLPVVASDQTLVDSLATTDLVLGMDERLNK